VVRADTAGIGWTPRESIEFANWPTRGSCSRGCNHAAPSRTKSHPRSHSPVVRFKSFLYQSASWKRTRRVVAKMEFHFGELFPRVGFIVTNLTAESLAVVRFYNKRGTAEQWINEVPSNAAAVGRHAAENRAAAATGWIAGGARQGVVCEESVPKSGGVDLRGGRRVRTRLIGGCLGRPRSSARQPLDAELGMGLRIGCFESQQGNSG
jgi:hypothetical protein